MEYALGDICKDRSDKESICLNPCCNGICSRRETQEEYKYT